MRAATVRRSFLLCSAVATCFALTSPARADRWVYLDENRKEVKAEARLAGSGQGVHALELANGRIRLVPQGAVLSREAAEGPAAIDARTMAAQLAEEFGAERFRYEVSEPFVVGLVLATPLHRSEESRARGLLSKVARFMGRVEDVFEDFARQARIETQPPRFPLVVLIFETDDDFMKYAEEASDGEGISAVNIAGFYSSQTNILAIRLSECATFAVPLHEAIHQQVYNRQVFQRLAVLPVWFNEGIATGFEGDGDRIKNSPLRVNAHYAQFAFEKGQMNWTEIVRDDRTFGADVFAGEAYTAAWSLHWLLVTRYPEEYAQYVRRLGQLEPLQIVSAEQRLKDFRQAFGRTPEELQEEFPTALEAGLRRQKIAFERQTAGVSVTQSNLAEVQVTAVQRAGGPLRVQGRMKNISPLRDMSFHVIVETETGLYADWYVPSLSINRAAPLPLQQVRKRLPNAPGGNSSTFRVRVRSVPPDSEEGQRWKRGELPVPEFREF
jgi:hypothetical protein